MPFTPTHVVAIIPIAAMWGRALPFSALAIGSMVPDFPLFVPYAPAYGLTHSWIGVLTACLPLGMAIYFAFQALMKVPLWVLLPRFVQCRTHSISRPVLEPNVRFFVCVAVAVALGALTHVAWDTFTHQGRWGTQAIPMLNATAFTAMGRDVPGYKVFQFASTFVGLPALFVIAAWWLARQSVAEAPSTPSVPIALKIATLVAGIGIPFTVAIPIWTTGGRSVEVQLFQTVTSTGLVYLVIAMLYCAGFHVVTRGKYL